MKTGELFDNRYYLICRLGEGASAQVWKAADTKANNLIVALKVFSAKSGMDTYGIQNFAKEFTAVHDLNHTNLLKPLSYDICNGTPYLVLQYCENGSSKGMIGQAEEEDVIKLLHDVAAGLEYLHDHDIVHQDIKPDNILLDDNCNFLVTDFGISVASSGDSSASSGSAGTTAYMAPERFDGTPAVKASDIWSLGATAFELATGDVPFGDNGGVVQAAGEKIPSLPSNYQPEVKDMITACLAAQPWDRPFASDIRQKIDIYWETGKWKRNDMRRIIWGIAASLVFIILCGGLFYWDYNRTKISYYKDYTEVWSVPVGVGKVSSSNAKHMNRMYKFEKSQGKVRRISHVNSLGNIIVDNESERNERPVDQRIYYTSEGKVSRIKVFDRGGKVLYVKAFNENLKTMLFQYDDEHNTERTIATNTVGYGRMLEDNSSQKGRITRWWIDYDDKGYTASVRFAGLDNSNVGDMNNIYGRKMTHDKKGRITEIHYIGKDGKPQPTRWGLGIKKFYYDKDDNWIKAEYKTVDDKPSLDDSDGVGVFEMEYDKYGNCTIAYHKNSDGLLMLPKKNSIAGYCSEYNDKGFLTKQLYLGVDGNPSYANDGSAGYALAYDDNGYVVSQEFIDTEGNPCETSQGNSKNVIINDDKGNLVEIWKYGLDGNLCTDDEGIAGYEYKYDSIGQIIEEAYYGIDKLPCNNEIGESSIHFRYNDKGLMVERSVFGKDKQPAFNNNHVCHMKIEYDPRGNMTRLAFYDQTGVKLVKSNESVAGWNLTYDDFGNELERSFFDEKNDVCELFGMYAKCVNTYDNKGHQKSKRFYNKKGNLTLYEGLSGEDYKCDDRGNVIEKKPIGTNGKQASGHYEERYEYDNLDNCTSISYFNNGIRVNGPAGYHKNVISYNTRNQVEEVKFYNTTGNLTLSSDEKVAIMKNEYDDKGYRVKISYFGVDSKPCVGREGWAYATMENDAFGNITRQCFYGVDGKPTNSKRMSPVGIAKYDKHNNVVLLAAQDTEGNYIINPNTGWSIQKSEYNERSQILSMSYYNANEKPMINREKYHKVMYKYDEKGRQSEESYWGRSGEKVNNNFGYHRLAYYNNENDGSQLAKAYTATGFLIGTLKKTGKGWVLVSENLTNHPEKDWESVVDYYASICPQQSDNKVILQAISRDKQSVTITIKYGNQTKSDVERNMLDNVDTIKRNVREMLKLPSAIKIVLKLYDKDNQQVYYE